MYSDSYVGLPTALLCRERLPVWRQCADRLADELLAAGCDPRSEPTLDAVKRMLAMRVQAELSRAAEFECVGV